MAADVSGNWTVQGQQPDIVAKMQSRRILPMSLQVLAGGLQLFTCWQFGRNRHGCERIVGHLAKFILDFHFRD